MKRKRKELSIVVLVLMKTGGALLGILETRELWNVYRQAKLLEKKQKTDNNPQKIVKKTTSLKQDLRKSIIMLARVVLINRK